MVCAVSAALREWRQRTEREPATKILRETVWFYWQFPRLERPLVASKYPRRVPWSDDAAAIVLGGKRTGGRLVIEHVVPFNLTLRWLIDEAPGVDEVLAELPKRLKCAVVTREESARLPDVGTPQERYRAAGLDLDRLRSLDERHGFTEMALCTADGREIVLGTEEDVRGALAEMAAATGGSSGRGRWSSLFGLKAADAMPTDQADRLALEAEEFRQLQGITLSERTGVLLDRLAALRG